ncbi:MAG: heparinase II/III family protein [Opitutus sp.]
MSSPTIPHLGARSSLVALLFGTIILPALAIEPAPTRLQELTPWLAAKPASFTPPITDRAAWAARAGQIEFAHVVADAVAFAAHPIPPPDDSYYLAFTTDGNRSRWEKIELSRRGAVGTLTIAECLENKGRFVAPLEALITDLCAERTWVYSAHDKTLGNFRREIVEIDLGVANLGWSLATTQALLGDRLSPATRALLRENLARRVFQPYRDAVYGRRPEFWWMNGHMNWNAVCIAGVTGAALATLESPAERAWYIATAEHYIRHFLSGFTPDGYCNEGLGYWNYGFGHYAMLSETIRRATAGRLDLLTDPAATAPAFFGARSEILAGIYPYIADAEPPVQPGERLMALLGDRFGFPVARPAPTKPGLPRRFYEPLILTPVPDLGRKKIASHSDLHELSYRTWFSDGGVLIGRPASSTHPQFAVCVKGGSNNETHNHNDVGTFMVVQGHTMLICDPGKIVYTARNSSPQRYDSKVMGSYGHAVPLIAGHQQIPGPGTEARVLATALTPEKDTVKFDIRTAYAVPALKKLEREFIYERGARPSLTVADEVAFAEASTYEAALITWGQWEKTSDHELRLHDGNDAIRVTIDSGGQPFTVSPETLDKDVYTPVKPVRLALKVTAPVSTLRFVLTIAPEPR